MTFRVDEYCIENEIWKDIPCYENLYQASNLGRVRTNDGKITYTKRHGARRWKGRVLKNKTKVVNKHTGYRINLWKDGKPKDWLVARLVCMAFYGIPKDFDLTTTGQRITVNHKDGNRLNNKVDNLEWCTLKENVQHAFRTGLVKTQHKVALIIGNEFYKEFRSKSQAGLWLGRSVGYISDRLIKKKYTATHINGTVYQIIQILD